MEEKDTKTITMPLNEYRELIQNADNAFVKQYGYTKEEIEEMKVLNNSLYRNAQYWNDRYTRKNEELNNAKNTILELNKTISKLKQEIAELKQKKRWQFWK